MNKKQYVMMAAFLCATTTTMAAPVSVTTEEGYNTKISVKLFYHFFKCTSINPRYSE